MLQYIEKYQYVVFQYIETYQYIESYLFLQRTLTVKAIIVLIRAAKTSRRSTLYFEKRSADGVSGVR